MNRAEVKEDTEIAQTEDREKRETDEWIYKQEGREQTKVIKTTEITREQKIQIMFIFVVFLNECNSSIISGEMRFLFAKNVLPAEQHRFVPKKSVFSNLCCAVSEWAKNFDRGVATGVVYFVFCKAFDKVPITKLLMNSSTLWHYWIVTRMD